MLISGILVTRDLCSGLLEFGITPVGQPIHLELFRDPGEFRGCLEDVPQALRAGDDTSRFAYG